MTNISERVKGIIAKHLGIDRDKVTEDANFIDDLGADSLHTVELAMSLEDEFSCKIPDEAAESMFTVGAVIKFLETNAKSWESSITLAYICLADENLETYSVDGVFRRVLYDH
jgi:acyl carrier protein